MTKKILVTIFFGLFSFFTVNYVVLAQVNYSERITDFSSNIKVNQDASILVTEDITVYANGQTIRHGIYRDFPTTYKDNLGNKYVVGFDVKDVKVDGVPEIYTTSSLSNGIRVQIGKANVLLSPGIYKYSVTYLATRELGFFSDHDELYWNVTGNGWDYQIEKASATVTLPDGINPNDIKTEAYTGPMGSKQNNSTSYVFSDGHVGFVTAGLLSPNEGLTIVVSWPKGFVVAPTTSQLRSYWLQDNTGLIFGLLGLIIILIYYLFTWNKYGRDPKDKTIIAQYKPPKSISPSEMRYILNRHFDDNCLVADIIDLAVKGYIIIDKKISHYNLTLTDKKYDEAVVFDSQKVLLESLFVGGNTLDVGSYDHDILNAKNDFLFWITDNYKKNYFTNNTKYLVFGGALSLALIIISAFAEGGQTLGIICFMSVWLSIWSIGVITLVVSAYKLWSKVFDPRGGYSNLFPAIFSSLFALPFLGGEIFAIFIIYYTVSLSFSILFILLIALNTIFYFLLKQYTETGLRLVEEIKGFKLFLSVTEKDRMNFHNPPERTPELFEKYLPYALALGVENKWAEQFADVFADRDVMNSHPLWYDSSIYGPAVLSGFSSSFSHSISSSMTPPGQSSGFSGGGGGGGSSGGGGGGGGGGGW